MGDELVTETNDLAKGDLKDVAGPSTDPNQETATDNAIAEKGGSLDDGTNGDVEEVPRATGRLSQQDKSDSEAETVVLLPEVQHEGRKRTKAIKLEDNGSDWEGRQSDGPRISRHGSDRRLRDGRRRSPLKRKRGQEEPKVAEDLDERNSSDLSSNRSSPAPRARSSKTSESRSVGSRSSAPLDDDDGDGKLRKRTAAKPIRHTRSRSNNHSGTTDPTLVHSRLRIREDEASRRSLSPNLNNRVRPTQPNGSTQGVNKRRKPAPLIIDRQRKASEDTYLESDDSSSVRSHRRIHRLLSGDVYAQSAAKMPHKKNRDRSGRTLLARACAIGADEAQMRLNERPKDIDEADFAGNTPLQIASLDGKDKVVALLLKEGCDITCKNIDGDTPLIDAVENSRLEVVRLLLNAGVDPRARNAKGQEPAELVDLEDEDGATIKDLLLEARKESEATRRQSHDHRQHTRDAETPSAHASAASPAESTRSPPPALETGGRKRTARSQPSDEALLWVNASPGRLEDEAGKGNTKYVLHILGMGLEAHTDAIIAAVKGGHDEALNLMIALGRPDADPQPLQSAKQKTGHNTPMLAAIGRGNLQVIKLLLDQTGFDPTRRLYKGLTYPEIAAERKGDNWEQERDMLQKAFDEHQRTGGRRSNTTSPRRVRKQRAAHKEEIATEPSSSPQEVRKTRKSHSYIKDDPDMEVNRRPAYHGTAARQKGTGDQETSLDATDRLHAKSNGTKPNPAEHLPSVGHDDSLGLPRTDNVKPRRKLMSGNDLKTGQELRRRPNPADEDDADSPVRSAKPRHRQSFSTQSRHTSPRGEATTLPVKPKKASSEEPARTKDDSNKKRLRVSVSPQASKSDLVDVAKKKKRPRVGSLESTTDNATPTEPASVVAESVSLSPTTMNSGAAPVAFMGASTAPSVTSSPIQPLTSPSSALDYVVTNAPKEPYARQGNLSDVPMASEIERDRMDQLQKEKMEAERVQQENLVRENAVRREKEEAELQQRLRREAEEAQREAQRQAHEAELQAQLERQAEEARVAKIKRDEELQRRRMEEDKQRREEQERKRREREERENLRRMRAQEEEKRARLEALPNGLRRAAELDPGRAREQKEIKGWLPLRTVTTNDLTPDFAGEGADDRWVANIQVAPLLANQDLDLSQFTAWSRLQATPAHVDRLWRQLRNPMSNAGTTAYLGIREAIALAGATKPKFFKLKIFWIKLSDFMDIVPRHPHLVGIPLYTRPMVLNVAVTPYSRPPTPRSAHSSVGPGGSPLPNGNMTNGEAID